MMAFRESSSVNPVAVEQEARQTAQHIESAVMHVDEKGFAHAAVDEVNTFRQSHSPAETSAYVATIKNQLKADQMLPAVALFDANNNFKKVAEGGDYVSKAQLDKFKSSSDLNELQRSFVDYVQSKYDRIRNYNRSWETKLGGNNEAISQDDTAVGAAQQRALVDLFAKSADGTSLYDRIKDDDGNIKRSKMGDLLKLDRENPGKWLTAADSSALMVLYDWKLPPFGVGSLKKSEIEEMAKQNGTSLDKLQKLPPGFRDITE